MDPGELDHRFQLHSPSSPEVIAAHEEVRAEFARLADRLNTLLPDGREKSMVMTALDDGCMYANACIARTQLVK